MDCYRYNTGTVTVTIHGLLQLQYMDCYSYNTWTVTVTIHGLLQLQYKDCYNYNSRTVGPDLLSLVKFGHVLYHITFIATGTVQAYITDIAHIT